MESYQSFYFVRHGETDWNKAGVFQGHTDIPLNDAGKSQAGDRKNFFNDKDVHFFSSPLQRAKETADIITDFDQSITLLPEFMECNSAKGARYLLEKKGVTKFPELSKLDQEGEEPHVYIERVQEGLAKMFTEAKGKVPVIFAHGGTCCAICEILGVDTFRTPNCSIFYFKRNEQGYFVEKL